MSKKGKEKFRPEHTKAVPVPDVERLVVSDGRARKVDILYIIFFSEPSSSVFHSPSVLCQARQIDEFDLSSVLGCHDEMESRREFFLLGFLSPEIPLVLPECVINVFCSFKR